MRKIRKLFGPLLIIGAGLVLAACQGGASSGGGGPVVSAPSASSASSASSPTPTGSLASRASTTKAPPAPAGLKAYKNYSTTESLCAQTCKSEKRCVSQTFKPIQEINGYIAGQCQFYGR